MLLNLEPVIDGGDPALAYPLGQGPNNDGCMDSSYQSLFFSGLYSHAPSL